MLQKDAEVDTEVDLSQLAIDRGGSARPAPVWRLRLFTRYLLPAALLLGFAGVAAWSARDLIVPPRAVSVIPVVAVRAEQQAEGTPLFQAAGWVEPRPTPVRVAALAPGVIDKLLVVQDQPVTEGQAIATLVDRDARLALEDALASAKLREAELAAARAALAAATTRFESPVHLEAPLAEAEAELAAVEIELANLPFEIRRASSDRDLAERSYQGKLAARDAVTARAVDEARNELESVSLLVEELQGRELRLNARRTALARRCAALEQQLELKTDERQDRDVAAARVAAAEANVEQARVAVEQARVQLERMTVRSPIAGRVLRLVAEPGTMLSPTKGHGETHDGVTVATLYRPELLQLRVDVRFEDLPRVRIGQPVEITSPAAARPLGGEVLFLTSFADIQKNTLEVKVAIDDPPAVLKPEMLVQVTFRAPSGVEAGPAAEESHRLYLPDRVIHRDSQGPYVWLADRSQSRVRRQTVETRPASDRELVEILTGLNLASRVVASDARGLADGDRIRIVGEHLAGDFTDNDDQEGRP